MSLSTILKILANCFICNSNSSCGNRREYSDSVKENHKKKIRKKEDKYNYDDEIELSP